MIDNLTLTLSCEERELVASDLVSDVFCLTNKIENIY
jgi:hypothetical protein